MSAQHPHLLWGPPDLYPMGTGGLSPGVKTQGHEANRSPPTNAEVSQSQSQSHSPCG
jgi:hypothetical protein